jgi:hypothetical protein
MSAPIRIRPKTKSTSVVRLHLRPVTGKKATLPEELCALILQPRNTLALIHAGRPFAIELVYHLALTSSVALEKIGVNRRDFLRALAVQKDRWPIALGPYKKVLDERRQYLLSLQFGARRQSRRDDKAHNRNTVKPRPQGESEGAAVATLLQTFTDTDNSPQAASPLPKFVVDLEAMRLMRDCKSVVDRRVSSLRSAAVKGRVKPLEHLHALAVASAAELEMFERIDPDLVQKFARAKLAWPVVIEHKKSVAVRGSYVRRLMVGTDASFAFDPKKLLRQPTNQNPLAAHVENAIAMIEAIRKLSEVTPFFETADQIFCGKSVAELKLPDGLLPASLIQQFSALPPFSTGPESLPHWKEAVVAAIWAQTGGHPEVYPVFHKVGQYRAKHLSGGWTWPRCDKDNDFTAEPEPLPGTRDANIRDAIRQKVRRLVEERAPVR